MDPEGGGGHGVQTPGKSQVAIGSLEILVRPLPREAIKLKTGCQDPPGEPLTKISGSAHDSLVLAFKELTELLLNLNIFKAMLAISLKLLDSDK